MFTLIKLMFTLIKNNNMKKITLLAMMVSLLVSFNACETLNKFPTNTSGGIFSLNGNWRLVSTTDNNAQVGTIVTVSPAIASAFVKSIENNTYCYRANDEAWRLVSSLSNGGFSISSLASACSNSAVYKAGEITILTNNQIRINTKTLNDFALVQEWSRVIK